MSLIRLIVSALILSVPGSALAQPPAPQASASLAGAERGGGEWSEFASREDRFTANFRVSLGCRRRPDVGYGAPCGTCLARRVVRAASQSPLLTTAVERILTEKARRAYRRRDVQGHRRYRHQCWKTTCEALSARTSKLLQQLTSTTHDVEFHGHGAGQQLRLTSADGSAPPHPSTCENKLLIMEAPCRRTPTGPLQQSLDGLTRTAEAFGARWSATTTRSHETGHRQRTPQQRMTVELTPWRCRRPGALSGCCHESPPCFAIRARWILVACRRPGEIHRG
jgi:hypothetical protein